MSRAFVFPGQASQAVGMGREVAEAFAVAKGIFEEVDEALKQNLSRLMFKGPDDELALTENAQPAIMAVSLAVIRVLSEDGGIDLSQTAAFVAAVVLEPTFALDQGFDVFDAPQALETPSTHIGHRAGDEFLHALHFGRCWRAVVVAHGGDADIAVTDEGGGIGAQALGFEALEVFGEVGPVAGQVAGHRRVERAVVGLQVAGRGGGDAAIAHDLCGDALG